jgi:hypothetical protein
VEKLADVADTKWDFPFKLKGKKQIILQMGKFFKREEQERYFPLFLFPKYLIIIIIP